MRSRTGGHNDVDDEGSAPRLSGHVEAGAAMTRPLLQIALDKKDLPSALEPLQKAAPNIDIIECGTVLILAEGLDAVRNIRALFPDKLILADIRIAEAGKLLSTMAFEAGASLVSVVSQSVGSCCKQVRQS